MCLWFNLERIRFSPYLPPLYLCRINRKRKLFPISGPIFLCFTFKELKGISQLREITNEFESFDTRYFIGYSMQMFSAVNPFESMQGPSVEKTCNLFLHFTLCIFYIADPLFKVTYQYYFKYEWVWYIWAVPWYSDKNNVNDTLNLLNVNDNALSSSLLSRRLNGELPSSIGEFSQLTSLYVVYWWLFVNPSLISNRALSNCNMAGQIPSEIGNLTLLCELYDVVIYLYWTNDSLIGIWGAIDWVGVFQQKLEISLTWLECKLIIFINGSIIRL